MGASQSLNEYAPVSNVDLDEIKNSRSEEKGQFSELKNFPLEEKDPSPEERGRQERKLHYETIERVNPDLASYDELERHFYGGDDAITYFCRITQKCTWFSTVPITLIDPRGVADFNEEYSVKITRVGDYLNSTWLRVTFPEIRLASPEGRTIRWTNNIMHNLIEECCLMCNDIPYARFDNYSLDFWSAFQTPAGMTEGYKKMIGNTSKEGQTVIPSFVGNLPLLFWFSNAGRENNALPTASLPYSDLRIVFKFRKWEELLVMTENGRNVVPRLEDLTTRPSFNNCEVWANYSLVNSLHRKNMACKPRNVIITDFATEVFEYYPNRINRFSFQPPPRTRAFFFGCQNTTIPNRWSNYTRYSSDGGRYPQGGKNEALSSPFSSVTIQSQKQSSFTQTTAIQTGIDTFPRNIKLSAEHTSLMNPYHFARIVPTEGGYHLICNVMHLNQEHYMGNVTYPMLRIDVSPLENDIANDDIPYKFVISSMYHKVVAVSGGELKIVL